MKVKGDQLARGRGPVRRRQECMGNEYDENNYIYNVYIIMKPFTLHCLYIKYENIKENKCVFFN